MAVIKLQEPFVSIEIDLEDYIDEFFEVIADDELVMEIARRRINIKTIRYHNDKKQIPVWLDEVIYDPDQLKLTL